MSQFDSTRNHGSINLPLYIGVVVLLLVDCIPGGWVTSINLSAGLFLVPVFYLAVYGDHESAPIGVFLLGLLKDLLSATPIGFWTLLLCAFYGFAYSQRREIRTGGDSREWPIFAVICFGYYLGAWVLARLYGDMPMAVLAHFSSALVTVIAAPLIVYLLKLLFNTGDTRSNLL